MATTLSKTLWLLLFAFAAACGADATGSTQPVGSGCGDGICQPQEDCESCESDCGGCGESFCGDGTCEEGIEDCDSCDADCGSCESNCGDGICDPVTESCESCDQDCGDCSPTCGDASCDTDAEDCASCPSDCGACGSFCGDGVCDSALEDCDNCPSDCGSCEPFCGDKVCDQGLESCETCEADCGVCDDPVTPTNPPVALRIISWNVWHGNSRANFVDALEAFASSEIDVVGFQELSDKDKPAAIAARTGCPSCTYDAWIPGTSSEGGNVSIIWNKSRFHVATNAQGKELKYARKVHDRESVEDGAGGTMTTPKYITYVLLRDTWSKQAFWVMNAHGLASVEGKCGHPANKPRRLALYKRMMDAFKDIIEGKDAPVFVTGDYNVNYRCDKDVRHYRFPWRSFNRLSPKVKSNWEWHQRAGKPLPSVGTHKPHAGGKRIIDYVFAKASPDVSYESSVIWQNRRFGSDHAPVLATYLLRQK